MNEKRVLISGFDPFGGESVNPTAILARWVQASLLATKSQVIKKEKVATSNETSADDLLSEPPETLSLEAVLLPVVYGEAFEVLQKKIKEFDPHDVLAFGLAGGRSNIEFERVAINVMDSEIPDNKGSHLRNEPIDKDGAPAYFSTLPIYELVDALKKQNIPAKISNTAGTYVCNELLYRMLQANLHTTRRCGFIHVPYLPEQVKNNPATPSMPLGDIKKALQIILSSL